MGNGDVPSLNPEEDQLPHPDWLDAVTDEQNVSAIETRTSPLPAVGQEEGDEREVLGVCMKNELQ